MKNFFFIFTIYFSINCISLSNLDTALYQALMQNDVALITKVLSAGAYVQMQDINGNTPLHYAVLNRSLFAVKLLISCGAIVNKANYYGETPLHIAAQRGSKLIAINLLDAGALVSTRNKYGCTPLHISVEKNDIVFARILLNRQPSAINIGCCLGETALHKAVISRNIELVKMLLKWGANINAQDCMGYTPLHRTVELGCAEHVEICDIILACHPNLHLKNRNGHTVLDIAERGYRKANDISKLIRSYISNLD